MDNIFELKRKVELEIGLTNSKVNVNNVSNAFSADFQLSSNYLKRLGFYVFAYVYKANPHHVLEVAHIVVCVNLL